MLGTVIISGWVNIFVSSVWGCDVDFFNPDISFDCWIFEFHLAIEEVTNNDFRVFGSFGSFGISLIKETSKFGIKFNFLNTFVNGCSFVF